MTFLHIEGYKVQIHPDFFISVSVSGFLSLIIQAYYLSFWHYIKVKALIASSEALVFNTIAQSYGSLKHSGRLLRIPGGVSYPDPVLSPHVNQYRTHTDTRIKSSI